LEDKVKKDAMVYSKDWFGKEIKSMEVMDEKFNAMLKYPKVEKGKVELDYNKPPTLSVKIPCWSGVWQPSIFDEEGNPLYVKGKSAADVTPLDFLKSRTHVICLLQCGGLWFINGKVSITWNLKQAIVQKPKTSSITEGVCFLKPKAADVEKLRSLPPPDEDVDPDGAVVSTIVDDSDDEHELPPPPTPTPVASAPAPAPAPASEDEPKKKKVVKKKVEA
jgi:hypothetical protein